MLTEDETWGAWSEAALIDAADRDEIAINPIIYAEGAHAAVAGLTLLTRDVRRYAGYFPKVALIAPE